MTTQENQVSKELISGADVCAMVSFGRTKLNKLVKEKNFPQPIRFAQNFIRWDLGEVKAWIEHQKAERA